MSSLELNILSAAALYLFAMRMMGAVGRSTLIIPKTIRRKKGREINVQKSIDLGCNKSRDSL